MGGDIGEIQLGSERELYKYINHYVVVKKKRRNKYSKIILVQVNIIFALPGYSSEADSYGNEKLIRKLTRSVFFCFFFILWEREWSRFV